MVISIFQFDPHGQFQGQKVITPKFTQITKIMSDLNSWLFSHFKDTLFFQIGSLVQKGFEVGCAPLFSLTLFRLGGFGNFRKKTSSFRLPYQRPSSSTNCDFL